MVRVGLINAGLVEVVDKKNREASAVPAETASETTSRTTAHLTNFIALPFQKACNRKSVRNQRIKAVLSSARLESEQVQQLVVEPADVLSTDQLCQRQVLHRAGIARRRTRCRRASRRRRIVAGGQQDFKGLNVEVVE